MQALGRRVTEFAADRRGWMLARLLRSSPRSRRSACRASPIASNVLHYLASDHPARVSHRVGRAARHRPLGARDRGGAPGGWRRLVDRHSGRSIRDPTFADRSGSPRSPGSSRSSASCQGVLSAVAAPDLLDDIGRASPLARVFAPEELRARLVPLVAADARAGGRSARFLTADGSTARLTLFVATQGYATLDPLAARALARARAALPGATVELTGKYLLLLAMQRYLLSTLALVAAPHPAGARGDLLHPAARCQGDVLRPRARISGRCW